jgi:hypothetical protein
MPGSVAMDGVTHDSLSPEPKDSYTCLARSWFTNTSKNKRWGWELFNYRSQATRTAAGTLGLGAVEKPRTV